MKKTIIVLTFFVVAAATKAQDSQENGYRNFPILITVQFHALTLPFHDLKTNFSNIGIGIGTEVSLNGADNWAQQFSIGWVRNRQVGNRVMFYTQPLWRPTLASNMYTEIKLGIGYTIAKRPAESYKLVDGDWISVGRKGKSLLTIPAGISIGYRDFSSNTYLSPFTTYQFFILKGYNRTIPLMPETLIQTGIRIHPNYNP